MGILSKTINKVKSLFSRKSNTVNSQKTVKGDASVLNNPVFKDIITKLQKKQELSTRDHVAFYDELFPGNNGSSFFSFRKEIVFELVGIHHIQHPEEGDYFEIELLNLTTHETINVRPALINDFMSNVKHESLKHIFH